MRRLFVLVEGQTEETFVNELLAPYLGADGFSSVTAKLMGNTRLRASRGGIRPWDAVRREIVRHLKHDSAVYVTTMVDFYGLPAVDNSPSAWPGRAAAVSGSLTDRASRVESALQEDLASEIGGKSRFIPFVVMHEFEGLLFSDCPAFAAAVGLPALGSRFQQIRDAFDSPEHINDDPETHPSHRVLNLMPGYRKPLHGNLAAARIGIDTIRDNCTHFRNWLERLRALPGSKHS